MILRIQLVLIIDLFLILLLLLIEDRRSNKARVTAGKLTEMWGGDKGSRPVRITADIPVKYSLSHNPDTLKATKAKNISTGGICLILNEKIPQGTLLHLEIEFKDSYEPVLAEATVVWLREDANIVDPSSIRYFTNGLEFVKISDKDKQRLTGFINGIHWIRNGRGKIEG